MKETITSNRVEVEMKSGSWLGILGILFILNALLSYEAIWGDFQSPLPLKGFTAFLVYFAIYYVVRILFTFIYIRDRKTYRWTKKLECRWVKPITMLQYRVVQFVPFLLLGYLPTFYGFCSGDALFFGFGLLYSTLSVFMLYTLWQLRVFNNNDLLQSKEGKKEILIIKRNNYGNF